MKQEPLSTSLNKLDRSSEEKSNTLDENRWLEGFPWEQIKQLSRFVDVYHINKGDYIFHQGDKLPFMCLILEGRIDIIKEGDLSNEQTIAQIGTGHTVGEMTLIDGEPRSASAKSASDTELCLLTEANFQRIRQDIPTLWGALLIRFVKTVTQRLRRSSGVLVELLDHSGEQAKEGLSEKDSIGKTIVSNDLLLGKMLDIEDKIEALSKQLLSTTLGEDLLTQAKKQSLVEGSQLNDWIKHAIQQALKG